MDIKKQLYALQDTTYQTFQKRIIPNDETIIGVRVPKLRKLAKQLAKEEGISYLSQITDDTHEERLLKGMIITYSDLPFEQCIPYVQQQVLRINNWSLCDTFCIDLKIIKQNQKQMLELLKPYFESDAEYVVRFGVVILLAYYRQPQYCDFAFTTFNQIKNDRYYVQMAIAWAISMYYLVCKEQTIAYLKNNELNDFTQRKAIQKIIELKQVSKEDKLFITKLKK